MHELRTPKGIGLKNVMHVVVYYQTLIGSGNRNSIDALEFLVMRTTLRCITSKCAQVYVHLERCRSVTGLRYPIIAIHNKRLVNPFYL